MDAALQRIGSDDMAATERVARALRYGVKHAGRAGAAMLPTLLQALPARFQQTRQPVYMCVPAHGTHGRLRIGTLWSDVFALMCTLRGNCT